MKPKCRLVNNSVEAFCDYINADKLDGQKYHALLCDPPYELGFMGKDWDSSGIAFQADTWAALAEHLLPGAFGMTFAGSRGWHRVAVAIEDAGLRIHPTIFCWAYGSGFPKATRIDTQIDKKVGATGKAGYKRHKDGAWSDGWKNSSPQIYEEALPATDLARAWVGHRYGLQALKPAVEPIIVFQKPYEDKPVDSIVKHGAAALNIDGGRLGTNGGGTHCNNRDENGKCMGHENAGRFILGETFHGPNTTGGRWPANFVLQHMPECKRVGIKKIKGTGPGTGTGFKTGKFCGVVGIGEPTRVTYEGFADADGFESVAEWDCVLNCPVRKLDEQKNNASRFFLNVDPVFYCSKVSFSERNDGLVDRCMHPTMKPIKLCKWLATLLLPPEQYAPRRLLVPFAGVGSEMIGALQAGWDEIVGVESEDEYVWDAKDRLNYWVKQLA